MKKQVVLISGMLVLVAIAGVINLPSFVAPPTDLPLRPQPVTSPGGWTVTEATTITPTKNTLSTKPSDAVSDSSTQPTTARIITPPTGQPYFADARGRSYPLRSYQALTTPNDPLATQWWTTETSLDVAWGYPAGDHTPIIAIIDSGFALAHEEFTDRWYRNTGETGPVTTEALSVLNCTDQSLPLDKNCNLIDDDFDGIVDNESGITNRENPSRLNCTDQSLPLDKSCNRIDDDGNGFVDDVTGWDFSNHDPSVQAGEVNPTGEGVLHGTLVTGAAGATGNNSVGVAGVNWTAQLMPLQALDDDGYGNTLTVARAIYYAADQGADIINISLGATAEDPYMRQAIGYALDQGSLVVAASGNDGCDCITYPARYPEVLAVGAFDESLSPSTFSNYGAELDLLAPGENFTLPTWSASDPTAAYLSGAAGTSFAAPYVSGLLGLLKSHQPDASWGELTAALLESSDRRDRTAIAPHSPTFGYGYAVASAPLQRVTSPATPNQRYGFGPMIPTDTLDSYRTHQCESTIPATRLYELTKTNVVRYTTSKLTRYQATQAGWATSRTLPVCVGLPHDQPAAIRTINLLSEIHNNAAQKWQP